MVVVLDYALRRAAVRKDTSLCNHAFQRRPRHTLHRPSLEKTKKHFRSTEESGLFTSEALSRFDGKEGRPAYFAYRGEVYDASGSRLWKNGLHVMKHAAGNDLTAMLKKAPHGENRIQALPRVGRLSASGETVQRPFHERVFYFFAYMNLALVFIIIFIIALWKWW